VATAIFQNDCNIQYSRILINTSLWYARAHCRVFGIQTYHFVTPPTFISAIFIDGGRQYNCQDIAKTTSPWAVMFTLLDKVWVAISKVVCLTFNNIIFRACFKDSVCQSVLFRILRNHYLDPSITAS